MGTFFKNNNEYEYINIPPKDIKFLYNITEDSFAYVILNNTFIAFKSLEEILYLIYCTVNNSIICYNLKNNKKINEIKSHHDEYISNFKHYSDKENKRDLIMTISLEDNNIRIWNLINWECILNIKNINKMGYLYSACFLYNNKQIYIITCNFNLLNNPEFIKIFDFKGNKIREINKSDDITYIIETYYDKDISKNYIITGNLGFVKSYNVDKFELYHKYYEKENGTHLDILIHKKDKIIQLIESCFDGNISIWNFHTGKLLYKIKVSKWLTCICLWNNNNLFVGCYDKTIKLIDLENKSIIKILEGHKDWVLTIKVVEHTKYGKCLISQGRRKDQIKLWINDI